MILNWFWSTNGLNISKENLTKLLQIATKDQLFQFNGNLYEQNDGVAMGSPLGPLLANTFLCYVEEELNNKNKLPSFYKRYVDDTVVVIKDISEAQKLLTTLNSCHPSIQFTMEIADNNSLPFLGMVLNKCGNKIETSVYRKPTNKGLLLHYQSHVDVRYKKALIRTMLHRAHNLSSTKEAYENECENIRMVFSKLNYPNKMIESAITYFNKNPPTSRSEQPESDASDNTIRIVLPFIDQKPADIVKRQLTQLNKKLDSNLEAIFVSRKLNDMLKMQEPKPPLVSQQLVIYKFQCGLCDASYVGYTARHLHQRIDEHRYSTIGKHRFLEHGLKTVPPTDSFTVIKKCTSKFDCLINEMFYIRSLKPTLNVQSDSVRAKLFV
ncbi:uncharacterized protein LOC110249719 [Exaiptasia diaphana]|uniref:Reverse transcriptase domain-containing protein n=1 Tax=Exaiptasia diaphana TaxID=2652724 RepID=A0A913XYL1_EXADI|nr:uncharacterized protein LOC110249719 [Exaiptasia diaphana]